MPPEAAAGWPGMLARLPPPHQAEVMRSRRTEDRLARAAARLMLQEMLADFGLNLSGWRREASGRPFLEGRPLDLSISHSDGWVAVALGPGLRLGVDVERHRTLDPTDFAGLLTPEEEAMVAMAPDPSRVLMELWCRREAVLKADGRGLGAGAAAIRALGVSMPSSGEAWHVQHAWLPEGCLALATDRAVPFAWAWRDWPG
jgi:4'-phosphopantetheinyl transferase